jgi:hypothetical protein
MHITLIRTGGIIPITKKAETNVDWSDSELDVLLKAIGGKGESPGQSRDAMGYQLATGTGTFTIDLEKVPAKYKNTFDELKDKLKVVKREK